MFLTIECSFTIDYSFSKYYKDNEKVTQEEVSNIFGINIRTFQRCYIVIIKINKFKESLEFLVHIK